MAKKKSATTRKTTATSKKTTKKKTATRSTASAAKPKAAAKSKPKATRGPKVRDVMSTTISVCHPHSSLAEAAQIMWQRDCGFVPVVGMATRALAGVITDRDIAMSAAIHGQSLHEVQVHAAMSPTVHTVRADDPLAAVHDVMRERQVNRVPVVDDDEKVVGVVSLNDLTRRAESEDGTAGRREVAATLAAIGRPHPKTKGASSKASAKPSASRKVKPTVSGGATRAAEEATRDTPGSMI